MNGKDRNQFAKQLADAEELCTARGARLTSIRRRVLELLLQHGAPIKAYDLQDALREPGKRIAPATVYRALDFLIQQGLAHRVNTLNAYVACTDPHEKNDAAHHPLMLVCAQCERSVEIEDNSVYSLLHGNKELSDFLAQADSIEIQGTCTRCKSQNLL